ncbi:MAG: DUF3043 domain-containing protein, partial [Actinomycetota bacterium]|nr:DUF3043 domain-containing protein [Actinomycetota bacterium]
MFRRRTTQSPDAETVDASPPAPSGKGRPTPRRSDAEAARRRRLAPPKDRREAAARRREQLRT